MTAPVALKLEGVARRFGAARVLDGAGRARSASRLSGVARVTWPNPESMSGSAVRQQLKTP